MFAPPVLIRLILRRGLQVRKFWDFWDFEKCVYAVSVQVSASATCHASVMSWLKGMEVP